MATSTSTSPSPSSSTQKTFAAQDSLPKLPIPDLHQTCRRYLDALRPLQSTKQHADTVHAVADFLARDGPALQDRLRRYASDKTSYIEQFCALPCVHPSISVLAKCTG